MRQNEKWNFKNCKKNQIAKQVLEYSEQSKMKIVLDGNCI